MSQTPETPIPAAFADAFIAELTQVYPPCLLPQETREALEQRSSGYPAPVLQRIWQEVPPRSLQIAIARAYPLPVCPATPGRFRIRDEFLKANVERLEEHSFVPIEVTSTTYTVATPFPWLAPTVRQAATRLLPLLRDRDVLVTYCTYEFYSRILQTFQLKQGQIPGEVSDSDIKELLGDIQESTRLMDLDDPKQPANAILRPVMEYAVASEATDIHISAALDRATLENVLRIQLRMGIMEDYPLKTPRPGRLWSTLLKKRLCTVAGVREDTARIVADGKFRVRIRKTGRATPVELDVRLSTMENPLGHHISLRLLDKSKRLPDVKGSCAFAPESYALIQRSMKEPDGIMIVAGPTGSGKTTLLNAIMEALNTGADNILTLEKPIEYQIAGIAQFDVELLDGAVNDQPDGWVTGFRGFLRKDPDIVLLGEIRDRQAAKLASEAAITGHPVWSTLHANSVALIPSRLHGMEVALREFTPSIRLGLACRLVRRVCRRCSDPVSFDRVEDATTWLAAKDLPLEWATPIVQGRAQLREARHGRPCAVCNGRGYHGYALAMETFDFSQAEVQELFTRSPDGCPSAFQLEQLMRQMKVPLLPVCGLRMIYEGATDLSAVDERIFGRRDEVQRCNEAFQGGHALWKWDVA